MDCGGDNKWLLLRRQNISTFGHYGIGIKCMPRESILPHTIYDDYDNSLVLDSIDDILRGGMVAHYNGNGTFDRLSGGYLREI